MSIIHILENLKIYISKLIIKLYSFFLICHSLKNHISNINQYKLNRSCNMKRFIVVIVLNHYKVIIMKIQPIVCLFSMFESFNHLKLSFFLFYLFYPYPQIKFLFLEKFNNPNNFISEFKLLIINQIYSKHLFL